MTPDKGPADGRPAMAPSRGRLLAIIGGGFAAAGAILVGAILPAEFHIDPTGLGKATGLMSLSAPEPVKPATAASGPILTTRYYQAPYRSDVIDIPLNSADLGPEGSELEYKVRMTAGDSLIYSWSVSGGAGPEEFYYDFHGETPAGPANPKATVMEYRQATGISSNGALTAPITGVHGWYLQNQSAKAVVVHLRISGFYQLVPPGEYGNTSGIKAKADKS